MKVIKFKRCPTRLYLLIVSFTLVAFTARGQFKSAVIDIGGLTCSLCSKGVENEFLKTNFVKEVRMDLNSNRAIIFFKENETIDLNDLAEKVLDAGFSVNAYSAVFAFDNLKVTEGSTFTFQNLNFRFIAIQPSLLNGEIPLKLLSKKYMNPGHFRKWKNIINPHISNDPQFYLITLEKI